MKTKFVYFTDPHFRGNNPLSRKDDFPATAFKKLSWVVGLANDLDAALICGGDWVQRPDTAPHVIAQIQRTLAAMHNPTFTILGNHDIYGYNPGTFFRTPLHIIEVAGTLKRLSAEPTIWRGVQLTGVDAHYDLDHNGRIVDYTEVNRGSGLPAIHVVHGFLTDHEWPNVPHTVLANVVQTQANLVLTGHEHSGFGVIKHDSGAIFCNPGALLRVSASVGDINQVVKVAEITVEDGEIDVHLVPLPQDIALPADQIIDRDRLLREKQVEQMISSFSDNLGSFSFTPGLSPQQMLLEFVKQEGVDAKVADEAKTRLQDAEFELAAIRAKEKASI